MTTEKQLTEAEREALSKFDAAELLVDVALSHLHKVDKLLPPAVRNISSAPLIRFKDVISQVRHSVQTGEPLSLTKTRPLGFDFEERKQ